MAECSQSENVSETVTEDATDSPGQQRLVLKLKKPKSNKKVQWGENAVDNEFMGKKISKCCCIYSKPHIFGESSSSESDSDDDCPHNAYCSGHKKKAKGHHHHSHGNSDGNSEGGPSHDGPNSQPSQSSEH